MKIAVVILRYFPSLFLFRSEMETEKFTKYKSFALVLSGNFTNKKLKFKKAESKNIPFRIL